jgi:DNA-binding MarR family transcriptional regulator
MSHYREDSFLPILSIGFALSKARNVFTAEMDIALAGTGVTSSYVGALLLISRGVARSSIELSKLLGINAGFATRVIDRLERQGLVRRARDSLDRRVVSLTLTETGRDVAARIAEIVPAVLSQRLSDFYRQEFATLYRLLGKFLDE